VAAEQPRRQPDSDNIAALLAQAFPTGSPVAAGWTGATSWQTAWGRCWTAMMR
jgi:hypothetical protein